MKRPLVTVLTYLALLQTAGATLFAATPQGTAFTYQGQLLRDGLPINDTCDFEFSLFEDSGGANQIGATQTVIGVTVVDGLFTVELNGLDEFGPTAFMGDARYLEIAVQCPPDVGFTPLSPLQPITAAPYALTLPGLFTEQNVTSPNLIGGFNGNTVSPGAFGATISGGGLIVNPNRVTDDFGTVGGGSDNQAGDSAGTTDDQRHATVSGGLSNTAAGEFTTVGGGANNTAAGQNSTVGGGISNIAAGQSSTVGGGKANIASAVESTVGGGISNEASGNSSTVGGGRENTALGTESTVGGGFGNISTNIGSTVTGGLSNTASGLDSTVGGGEFNIAAGVGGTIGGGQANIASGNNSTVGGGFANHATGSVSTVGGGRDNTASGARSTVSGGDNNTAAGDDSFAAGRRANANHDGAFVWADSDNTDFISTGPDQFLIRATGGVGIGTSAPAADLHIRGVDTLGSILVTPSLSQSSSQLFLTEQQSTSFGMIMRYNGAANQLHFVAQQSGVETAPLVSIDRSTAGNVGIGTSSPGHKLEVIGSAGKPGGGSWSMSSDRRLKKNVQDLDSSLDQLMKLRGVTFEYKDPAAIHELNGTRIGMIAQEVEEIFPDWVSDGGHGYKTLTFRGFEALTVEALRELRAEKDRQLREKDAEIADLHSEIADLHSENAELQWENADFRARLERIETALAELVETQLEDE